MSPRKHRTRVVSFSVARKKRIGLRATTSTVTRRQRTRSTWTRKQRTHAVTSTVARNVHHDAEKIKRAPLNDKGEECERKDGVLVVFTDPTRWILNVVLTILEACPDDGDYTIKDACELMMQDPFYDPEYGTTSFELFSEGLSMLTDICDKTKVGRAFKYLDEYMGRLDECCSFRDQETEEKICCELGDWMKDPENAETYKYLTKT